MHRRVTNSTSSEELRDNGSDRDLIVEVEWKMKWKMRTKWDWLYDHVQTKANVPAVRKYILRMHTESRIVLGELVYFDKGNDRLYLHE